MGYITCQGVCFLSSLFTFPHFILTILAYLYLHRVVSLVGLTTIGCKTLCDGCFTLELALDAHLVSMFKFMFEQLVIAIGLRF
jgi:hypothetical protein